MSLANLSIITRKKIKSGKLANLIPEFYELKDVIENNLWHNEEPVFDHTLAVFGNLEKIIRNSKKKIKETLNKIIDKNSRKNLLYLAALLHDIGKKETITNLGGGCRGCPGHERKGAEKAKQILRRFNLSQRESGIITEIIRNHGTTHDIAALESKGFQKKALGKRKLTHSVAGLDGKGLQKKHGKFKKQFSKIYLELILLAFADTIGSYLKKTKLAEFRYRINFYKKELKLI